mgnify:CR=1 FL=1
MGEMEKDALIAHGLAKFIKEKLLDNSDAYTTFVCDKCGLFAQRFLTNESTLTNISVINNSIPYNVELDLKHPCKQIIWNLQKVAYITNNGGLLKTIFFSLILKFFFYY